MGRPTKNENVRQYKLYLREDIAKRVDLLLGDPNNPGRLKHGALKAYIEKLVLDDLKDRAHFGADVLESIEKEFAKYEGAEDA